MVSASISNMLTGYLKSFSGFTEKMNIPEQESDWLYARKSLTTIVVLLMQKVSRAWEQCSTFLFRHNEISWQLSKKKSTTVKYYICVNDRLKETSKEEYAEWSEHD